MTREDIQRLCTEGQTLMSHVMRMLQDHLPRVARRWTRTGKFEKVIPGLHGEDLTVQLSDMGMTMWEAQMIAQDGKKWRNDIVTLCPTWG